MFQVPRSTDPGTHPTPAMGSSDDDEDLQCALSEDSAPALSLRAAGTQCMQRVAELAGPSESLGVGSDASGDDDEVSEEEGKQQHMEPKALTSYELQRQQCIAASQDILRQPGLLEDKETILSAQAGAKGAAVPDAVRQPFITVPRKEKRAHGAESSNSEPPRPETACRQHSDSDESDESVPLNRAKRKRTTQRDTEEQRRADRTYLARNYLRLENIQHRLSTAGVNTDLLTAFQQARAAYDQDQAEDKKRLLTDLLAVLQCLHGEIGEATLNSAAELEGLAVNQSLTDLQVDELAAKEGLTLLTSERSETGYMNVVQLPPAAFDMPKFQASWLDKRDGHRKHKSFPSAKEGALACTLSPLPSLSRQIDEMTPTMCP